MKNKIKKFIFIFAVFFFLTGSSQVLASEKTEINFFYSSTCPHCAEERLFLEKLTSKYPEIEVNKFLVSENLELLKEFYIQYDVPQQKQGLVPITFIDGEYFLGFNQESGLKIENYLKGKIDDLEKETIFLPFLGRLDPSQYSLLFLSVVLGFFDGFNICSLGALAMILALVLALRSRRKILFSGIIFIITTAFVYGILIILWYQIFALLASWLRTMEILIGILGIGGGIYFLKEFIRFKKYGPACEMGAGGKIISKFSSRMRESINNSKNLFLIAGTLLIFAGVITVVEFPCSAAIPVFYASILAKHQLPVLLYIFYITIFVFFYMLDEIVVFLITFLTMTVKLTSPRFVLWITLAEALILFSFGTYYLFGFNILF